MFSIASDRGEAHQQRIDSLASRIYSIPEIRRCIVSFLEPCDLFEVVTCSRELMVEASIMLYAIVDSAAQLRSLLASPSAARRKIYCSAALSLRNAMEWQKVPEAAGFLVPIGARLIGAELSLAHVPAILSLVRSTFPRANHLCFSSCGCEIEIRASSESFGTGSIRIRDLISLSPSPGLSDVQNGIQVAIPGFTVDYETHFICHAAQKVDSAMFQHIGAVVESRRFGTSSISISTDAAIDLSALSSIFDTAKHEEPLSKTRLRLSWGTPSSFAPFRDFAALQGHRIRDLQLVNIGRHSAASAALSLQDFAILRQTVLDYMPSLESLSVGLPSRPRDEWACLAMLDGRIAEGCLNSIFINVRPTPSSPLYNIGRYASALLKKDGIVFVNYSPILYVFIRDLIRRGPHERAVLATADLTTLNLSSYDTSSVTVSADGRLGRANVTRAPLMGEGEDFKRPLAGRSWRKKDPLDAAPQRPTPDVSDFETRAQEVSAPAAVRYLQDARSAMRKDGQTGPAINQAFELLIDTAKQTGSPSTSIVNTHHSWYDNRFTRWLLAHSHL